MLILSITVRFEIMTETYVWNFIFKNYKIGFNELRHARMKGWEGVGGGGKLLFKQVNNRTNRCNNN
jgi:hypothetical protein